MKSAVLFIVFNRPLTTQVVFNAIREARPPRLYVAADGPRLNVEGEQEVCEVTRSIIKKIDWECDVKTLFRQSNLGCRDAVSGAINWFFENEQEGIILEDDVVPAPTFFGFCDLMLERYRSQENVAMISGFNPLGAGIISSKYFYTGYASIWGWATWRSRWKLYDVKMSNWSKSSFVSTMGKVLPIHVLEYFIDAYEQTKNGKINTWDYQWSAIIQIKNLLAIKPVANLISNIGHEGTHSQVRDKNHNVDYGALNLSKPVSPLGQKIDIQLESDFYHYAFDDQKLYLLLRYALRKVGLLKLFRALRNAG